MEETRELNTSAFANVSLLTRWKGKSLIAVMTTLGWHRPEYRIFRLEPPAVVSIEDGLRRCDTMDNVFVNVGTMYDHLESIPLGSNDESGSPNDLYDENQPLPPMKIPTMQWTWSLVKIFEGG
jgi:hypothetical protein